MGLYERITANDDSKIPVHALSGYLHVWLNNSEGLGSAAGSRIVANYSLTAGEITEAQAIKAKYDAMLAVGKPEFLGRVHAAFMLAEAGEINESELKTLLGF